MPNCQFIIVNGPQVCPGCGLLCNNLDDSIRDHAIRFGIDDMYSFLEYSNSEYESFEKYPSFEDWEKAL